MGKKSAGLMLYRQAADGSGLEILLVHPGGPFWRKKDDGAWTVPKGELDDHEEPLTAAKREFKEELGWPAPDGVYFSLGLIKQKGGKTVYAWAVEGDFDPAKMDSNTFTCEWPPNSKRMQEFPEVDRAEWFTPETATRKILAAQVPLIDELLQKLRESEIRG